MKGMFITLEGVEGCGKSTQVTLLASRLCARGYRVLTTREPGGTPISEQVRDLLLDPDSAGMAPITELLLYEAARAQHVHEKILPAISSGHVVLCDRFTDSTTAYQGAGRAIDAATLDSLHTIATQGLEPDLTILIDLPVSDGLIRAASTGRADRMEQEPKSFHESVRAAFLALADREPERVRVMDGRPPLEAVSDAIEKIVLASLAKNQIAPIPDIPSEDVTI